MTGSDTESKELVVMIDMRIVVIMIAAPTAGDVTLGSGREMIATTDGQDHAQDPGDRDLHEVVQERAQQEDEEPPDTRGSTSTMRSC